MIIPKFVSRNDDWYEVEAAEAVCLLHMAGAGQ